LKILFFDINPSPLIEKGIMPAFKQLGFDVELPKNKLQLDELKYPRCIYNTLTDKEKYIIMYKTIENSNADIVFLNGANYFYTAVPDACEKMNKAFIYWATEDPVLTNLMFPVVERADLVLSPAIESVELYKSKGLNAHLMMFGCNPDYHKLGVYNIKYDLDLILQASFYLTHPDRLIGYNIILDSALKLEKSGKKFNVYGAFWNTKQGFEKLKNPSLYKGFHPNEDIPDICASSKIILGVQCNTQSKTQQSMRAFEILASGGFHLTQWSNSMDYWFKNGKHLVVVKNKKEAYEKMKYYLKNKDKRDEIVKQGYDYVRNNHTYLHRIKESILPNL